MVLNKLYGSIVFREYIVLYTVLHTTHCTDTDTDTDTSLFLQSRRAKLGQIQGGLQRAIQDSTKGELQ